MRPGFMRWGLHTMMSTGTDILTLSTFVSGLIIWNIAVFVAVWLFAALYNNIKE